MHLRVRGEIMNTLANASVSSLSSLASVEGNVDGDGDGNGNGNGGRKATRAYEVSDDGVTYPAVQFASSALSAAATRPSSSSKAATVRIASAFCVHHDRSNMYGFDIRSGNGEYIYKARYGGFNCTPIRSIVIC